MADIVGAAIRARQLGFDETQGFFDQAARRRAGQAMAGGDVQGAAGELYGAGMLDAGMALENEQQRRDAALRQQAQQDRVQAQQQQQQNATFMKNAATVLRRIPPARRAETFTGQIAPALKAMGADDQTLAQMVNYLDDTSLDTFIGEVDNQIKLFNTSGGVVAVDPSRLQQDINDPNASRVVYQDPTYQEYRQAQIEATRQRAGASAASAEAARARAAKTRAAPAGGRVSSAGVSGLPSGFVLD